MSHTTYSLGRVMSILSARSAWIVRVRERIAPRGTVGDEARERVPHRH